MPDSSRRSRWNLFMLHLSGASGRGTRRGLHPAPILYPPQVALLLGRRGRRALARLFRLVIPALRFLQLRLVGSLRLLQPVRGFGERLGALLFLLVLLFRDFRVLAGDLRFPLRALLRELLGLSLL